MSLISSVGNLEEKTAWRKLQFSPCRHDALVSRKSVQYLLLRSLENKSLFLVVLTIEPSPVFYFFFVSLSFSGGEGLLLLPFEQLIFVSVDTR